MRILRFAVGACLVAVGLGCSGILSFGQNLPDAPSQKRANIWISPLKDPFFWAGTGVHTSSVIGDVQHVQACEKNHTCYEANRGADKYKNRIPEIAFMAGANYGCSLMLYGHKYWRAICMALPVTIGILHWRDATRIYQP
jgi:hypothetical protein